MRTAPAEWARETLRTYVGNPTAVRDYRSQIRGNRALVLLTLYLALLLLLTGMIYSSTTGFGDGSIAYAQYQLSQFYNNILMLLGGVVAFVTPALSALAVAGERQRKSLDLIFSAPVSPHSFLIGKLISSVRWVAMLIVLALPISAVSIVLGGATWADAVGAYVILLSSAMVFAALAILVSSLAPSPVSAVVLSYLVVGAYAVPVGALTTLVSYGMSAWGLGVPWYVGLTPFTAGYVAPGTLSLGGWEIPNCIPVAITGMAITRLILLGAASALSGYGAKETRHMRQWALLAVGILMYTVTQPTGFGTPSRGYGSGWGASTATFLLALGLFVPHLVTWAYDAERKHRPDGWFRFRNVWQGTPSGSLPYLLLLGTVGFGASAARGWVDFGQVPHLEFAVRGAWLMSLGFFWWAVGQYLSSTTYGLKTARVAMLAAILLIAVLPGPVLSPYSAVEGPGTLAFTMFAPVILTSGKLAATHTLVLAVFGMLLFMAARRHAAQWRLAHGGT